MNEKHLHIVCLDVPYPVDYGGVFDLFFKIKYLHKEGVKIHLHCFDYGRGQQPELNKYCQDVHYYKRVSSFKSISGFYPYIVASRANPELLKNLRKDTYPVLLEGIHCTYFLKNGSLTNRNVFVRLHNVEYQYYRQLAETTGSWLKKLYFLRESKLLHKYEASLHDVATSCWTVNNKDLEVFTQELGYTKIDNLPPFLPEYKPKFDSSRGQYCLYHGNLSVPENEKAVNWLIEHIFSEIEIPLIIAGKNPPPTILKLVEHYPHICLIENPDEKEMQELIKKAQVNLLPSFNNTGIKLKLINALFNGKHCLVNTAAVEGTGLECCCTIADTCDEMKQQLKLLYDHPFTLYQFKQRDELLHDCFDNTRNAKQMIEWIWQMQPAESSKKISVA